MEVFMKKLMLTMLAIVSMQGVAVYGDKDSQLAERQTIDNEEYQKYLRYKDGVKLDPGILAIRQKVYNDEQKADLRKRFYAGTITLSQDQQQLLDIAPLSRFETVCNWASKLDTDLKQVEETFKRYMHYYQLIRSAFASTPELRRQAEGHFPEELAAVHAMKKAQDDTPKRYPTRRRGRRG
jgi:hypothetical protein